MIAVSMHSVTTHMEVFSVGVSMDTRDLVKRVKISTNVYHPSMAVTTTRLVTILMDRSGVTVWMVLLEMACCALTWMSVMMVLQIAVAMHHVKTLLEVLNASVIPDLLAMGWLAPILMNASPHHVI